MEFKKITKIGASLLLSVSFLLAPVSNFVKAEKASIKDVEKYELNNPVKAYYNSINAKDGVHPRSTYKKGEYYIFRKYKGMINITKTPGQAGGWINPKDNKGSKYLSILKDDIEDKKQVGTYDEESGEFIVKVKTFGYMNSKDARNHKNNVRILKPGRYYVYEISDDMINISEERGVAGSWINPNSKEEVKPSIPLTKFKSINNK